MSKKTLAPEKSEFDISLTTQADLSGSQYHFANLTTGELAQEADAGEVTTGILQDAILGTASAPKTCTIRTGGLSKLKLADTIVDGDYIKSDNDGKGVPTAVDREHYGAIAVGSGSSGDIILVRVQQGDVSHA